MYYCAHNTVACPGIRKGGGGRKSERLLFGFHLFKGGGAAQKTAKNMIFSTEKVAKYR